MIDETGKWRPSLPFDQDDEYYDTIQPPYPLTIWSWLGDFLCFFSFVVGWTALIVFAVIIFSAMKGGG